MDNSERIDHGSGGLGRGWQRGKIWDNCNGINNKIFKKAIPGTLKSLCVSRYSLLTDLHTLEHEVGFE